jgi:hypothetical protein
MSDPAPRWRVDAWITGGLVLLALVVFAAVTFGHRGVTLIAAAAAFLLLALGIARKAPWLGRLRRSDLVPVAVFLALVATLAIRGAWITGDGPLLYMQVRSLVIDGDLDYTNEYRDFVPKQYQLPAAWKHSERPNPNAAEPGPAILWMPFFVVAHGLVLVARAFGARIAADGYSPPYVAAVCFGNTLWAYLGVVLTARIARQWFRPPVAALCAAAAWLATPLVWYSVVESTMPHACATFAVALFLWRWFCVRDRPGSRRAWVLLAVSAGLLVSMQRYDGYFFICPLVTLLGLVRKWPEIGPPARRRAAALGLSLAAVFVLTIVPLLYTNLSSSHASLSGESDLLGFTFGHWAHPYLVEILFSSRNGLLAWTPAAYLGVIGLAVFARRDRRIAGTLLLTLAVGIYLLAASYSWHGGWSFGSRRFTEAFPLFALGLCALTEAAIERPLVLATLGLCGLVGWNLTLATEVMWGMVPRNETISFGEAASDSLMRAYRRVGNPGAAPASWLFALRYDVTPDRFDRIVGREPSDEVSAALGKPAEADVLGAGWCGLRNPRCPWAPGWSEGERSTLLISLTEPTERRLSVRAAAAPHPRGIAQTVSVAVNGTPVGQWSFWPRENSQVLDVPAAVWKRGLNEVEFRYAWTTEGQGPRHAWHVATVTVIPRHGKIIGAPVTVNGVGLSGRTVTVDGTGFSTLTVVNFFNEQGARTVNLGGFDSNGDPRIPLTLVDSTRFTFPLPAGVFSGSAYVQVLNPPFVPSSSSSSNGELTIP